MATATTTGPAARRVRQQGGDPMASATLIAQPGQLVTAGVLDRRGTYICPECGHVLRVSGLGRHCVYFELDDNRADNPVMNRVCPVCAHGLPGKNRP
jgi:hypothetical protein